MISRWPYRSIRWSLSVVFLYSGILKLLDPKSFAVVIEAYSLIPEAWLMPVAVILPALEIIAAFGLVWDIRWSLETITGLLILFMMILGYGIYMGLDVDCGCFGPDDPEQAFSGLRQTLYRDFVMMMGILFLYGCRYAEKFKLRKL
jgi:uncharacterized membrane protein